VTLTLALLGEGHWWTWQVLYDGAVEGLAIGIVAMGVVLVFRATGVVNFAVGNLGLPGAALLPLLVLSWGVPFWPALAIALVVGVLFAAAVELTVVRRLFDAPRVVLLVATVGIATLAQAVVAAYPAVDARGSGYPIISSAVWHDATPLGLRVKATDLAVVVVVPVLALLLGWALNRTTFGKAVIASSDNRDLSRLSGVEPRSISTAVWVVAGVVATLAMVLLSGRTGATAGIQGLGPLVLGRALAAAALSGMRSFPRAMAAGVAVGVGSSVVGFRFFDQRGLADFVLAVAVLVAVYLHHRSEARDVVVGAFAPKVRPVPQRLQARWWVRHLPRLVLGGLLTLLLAAMVLDSAIGLYRIDPSRYLVWSVIASLAVCAASVTVLTGWAGQLSLAQMAFAGLGALTAAALARGVAVDIGVGDARVLDVTFRALPYGLAMLAAAVSTAALAALVGLGALRVRGLMLGVSTFAFGLACQQYLFARPIFTAGFVSSVPFERGELLGLDLRTQRTWFTVVLAVLVLVIALLGRLRRSAAGRATIAVRDNPDAAAAYAVHPARTKLTAFALAGGLAGLGGALVAASIESIPYAQRLFLVEDSLRMVAAAVIGGLGSVAGPVLGVLWVEGLPSFFPGNDLVPLLASSLGLLFLLLYFPGGFVQLAFAARDRLFDRLEQRLGPVPPGSTTTPPPAVLRHVAPDLPGTVLRTRDVTVRFGGVVAVDGVAIEVHRDEVVALIGANGSGKSTFMNAVGGFVPAAGEVELLGERVETWSAPARARAGLGRTFQAASLFPELTVLETVQVAVAGRRRPALLSTALCLPVASRAERADRAEAQEIIHFLGLGRYADHHIADLSTGTRRIVELAGLLALAPPVLCLDEPTAGLAQRESEAFGPLLLQLRDALGSSVLIVEHDMPLILGMSDRIYCLEAGQVIAEGRPSEVRDDPRVIASYLGTDERAIARSGSSAPPSGSPISTTPVVTP
jgi:ABC-type branched-subunit amino acid transport system ATPase component/ABC-type branched-subunit amino acid transport system permease subunit